jgi:hypothetical protein
MVFCNVNQICLDVNKHNFGVLANGYALIECTYTEVFWSCRWKNNKSTCVKSHGSLIITPPNYIVTYTDDNMYNVTL